MAMATATRKASIPLEIPEIKSPAIVSLMAFVMESPGTKSIMELIIMVSLLEPILYLILISAIRAAIEPHSIFIKNSFARRKLRLLEVKFIKSPIKNDTRESFIFPPKARQKKAVAVPENNKVALKL